MSRWSENSSTPIPRIVCIFVVISLLLSIFLFSSPRNSSLVPGVDETIRIPTSSQANKRDLQHVKHERPDEGSISNGPRIQSLQHRFDDPRIPPNESDGNSESSNEEARKILQEDIKKLRNEMNFLREEYEKREEEQVKKFSEYRAQWTSEISKLREERDHILHDLTERMVSEKVPLPVKGEDYDTHRGDLNGTQNDDADMMKRFKDMEMKDLELREDLHGLENIVKRLEAKQKPFEAPSPPSLKSLLHQNSAHGDLSLGDSQIPPSNMAKSAIQHRRVPKKQPHRILEYVPNPPEFDIPNPKRNQTMSNNPEVCVIAPWHRSGLYNDMHVYMSAFTSVKLVEKVHQIQRLNCTLCIQLSSGQIYYDYMPYCKTQAIMINVEWADKHWFWERFDYIFAKTNHTMNLFNDFWDEHRIRFPNFTVPEMVFTKHTYLEQAPYPGSENLNFSLVAHLAGESVYKSTDLIIISWLNIKNKHGKHLVMSCFGQCKGSLKTDSYKSKYKEEVYLGVKRWVFPEDSMTVYVERMPDAVYRNVLETAGFYLCPSRTEGYGMYIDDARSRGAVILTTDNWPMNELVTPENGFLVKWVRATGTSYMFGSKLKHLKVKIDRADLQVKLEELLENPIEDCIKKGKKSREFWVRDSKHFYQKMVEVLEDAKNKNDNETADIHSDFQMYTKAPTKMATTCKALKRDQKFKKKTESCQGWKQTGGCKPSGKREPAFDKDCLECIDPDVSGYCLCDNDRHIGFGCHHEHLRCIDVCPKMNTPRKVLCPTFQEVSMTPKNDRWDVWDDPSCRSGCTMLGHCGDDIPCCVKPKGVPQRLWGKDFLPNDKGRPP